jgi:hypothetical protein
VRDLGQAPPAPASVPGEKRAWLYLVRLAAFALILIAIIRKNRRSA